MLNWDAFSSLPGSQDYNFEMLCRMLINRNYGRFGDFNALAMQPGVEFDLQLHTMCSLGDVGRWYGWQCRWYGIPSGTPIGSARRKKIIEAIKTTERVNPGLTDWVLWTRYPLTKGDQEWFRTQSTPMHLHLWTTANIEGELSGYSELFRSTYFGELILTPAALSQIHQEMVAPIMQRWQPEVHQIIQAERSLRQMLGGPEQWDGVKKLASHITTTVSGVENDNVGLPQNLEGSLDELINLGRSSLDLLQGTYNSLLRGDLERVHQQLASPQIQIPTNLAVLPRHLRAERYPAAISATNLLNDIRQSRDILNKISPILRTRLIAVKADAGCGKTELAAQLTAELRDRPAGIILHGRDLSAGDSLDDLARRVVIQGRPVPSMEALLAAVDSAGRRALRRLPIIIDGLNESEDPRDWKRLLATLDQTMSRYPYVLFVCTLRTQFVEEALPPETPQLEILGFEEDTFEAIQRYFQFYQINARDALLPRWLLKHPLTLRLFCEVTNPSRDHLVGIEAMPETLTALFDRYLEQTIVRVAELAPRTRRLHREEIRATFTEIGKALWEEKSRSLDLESLRRRLGDNHYPWTDSIIKALEENGILLRVSGGGSGSSRLSVLYDLLAGHMVAEAIIAREEQTGFETWLSDPETGRLLNWLSQESHPLGIDIFRALVGLVPRRLYRRQLWQFLVCPLRLEALRRVADLEGAYIDEESIDQLLSLATRSSTEAHHLFDRLKQTRGAPQHPLNSEFVDVLLRPMAVAERDLVWTEWVRRNREELCQDLERLEIQWRILARRDAASILRARWVKWMLTSTNNKLRDQATSALYWFGRGDPNALFNLALDSLGINDQYVSERLIAASYGVVMAHQLYDPDFSQVLAEFLGRLSTALTGTNATHPTNHYLVRLYVQGMFTFSHKYYPDAVPEAMRAQGQIRFASGQTVDPIDREDCRAEDVDGTFHLDFENYTVGRLFMGRGNYDMDHPGYKTALAHIRGIVWNLGWREPDFGKVDREITQNSRDLDRAKTERYGKKYSWIGFYGYAGILENQEGLPYDNQRLSDVDIDPSFPVKPPPAPFSIANWIQSVPEEDELWIRNSRVEIQRELLYRQDIDHNSGPWIATYGFLKSTNHKLGRRVFGFLSTLLVSKRDENRLLKMLKTSDHPGRFGLSDPSEDYYIFAGEIPWHPDFARGEDGEGSSILYQRDLSYERGNPIQVELVVHRYSYESYHNPVNDAGGALIPPQPFSTSFDLRGIPQTFNQVLPDGTVSALSFAAPAGFEGELLYLREDLLHQYAAGRGLIWVLWGEKQLEPFPDPEPEWLKEIYQDGQHIWRYIRKAETLSRLFASK